MRELKVRFWNGEEFIYLDYSKDDIYRCGSFEEMYLYTGLKDRIGSEWYEGDAIYDRDDREAGMFIIEWCASHAQFVGHCHSDGEMLTLDEFEGFIVYGNIHQNPELLS